MRKVTAALVSIIAAAIVAACGSSGPSQASKTAAATKCFQGAIALRFGGDSTDSCVGYVANKTYKMLQGGSGTSFSTACTHEQANHYVCDVTGSGTKSFIAGGKSLVPGGFYAVVFDGSSIVYRSSSG